MKTRHPALSLQAALVDLDGTLVNTLDDFVLALRRMLADMPAWQSLPWAKAGWNPDLLQPDASMVAPLVGKGSENLVISVLKVLESRIRPAQPAIDLIAHLDWAMASYQRHYAAINGLHAVVYPGAVKGLQQLQSAGFPMVCLTNKPLAFAKKLLKLKELDGYFCEVFGGDSFARKKPDPLPLRESCRFLGTEPAHTLMVGDSSNDALAARAAGCPVVVVNYGYNHGHSASSIDADGWLDSLADIGLWIQSRSV